MDTQNLNQTGIHADELGTLGVEACKARLLADHLDSHELGSLGEQICHAWLIERHWHVLDRNWHCRFGELDIIALTPHGTIAFIEVKTRRSTLYGLPEEAVHASKQVKIRRSAVQWLMSAGKGIRHIGVRFDVIAVTVDKADVRIHHIPEAF